MVYGKETTYEKIVDIFDIKYTAGSTIGYTLPPGTYEISDLTWMLKFLLPSEVKVKNTIDVIRLRSNITTKKTKKLTRKSFFHRTLGFTHSHSGPLDDPPKGFIQKIPASYESERPINITGIDKIRLKSHCNNGSIVNGKQDPIVYSFALDKSSGHKINETKFSKQ